MIIKVRRKPIVFDAILFDGSNHKECEKFLEGNFDSTLNYPNVKTLNGAVRIEVGEYICKGSKGEFYPCKADIFWNINEKLVSWDDLVDECKKIKLDKNKKIIITKDSIIIKNNVITTKYYKSIICKDDRVIYFDEVLKEINSCVKGKGGI